MSNEVSIEIRPRRQFREFIQSRKRWDCLVVHRRGGKTYSSLQKLLLRALSHKIRADERVEMTLATIGDGVTMAVKR